METITSRQNPLLRHAKKLLTSRSYRESCGEFAADGTKLLEEAARWVPGLHTVIAADDVEICRLPEEVRVVRVPRDVMASVSQMDAPQGAIFLCKIPQGEPIAEYDRPIRQGVKKVVEFLIQRVDLRRIRFRIGPVLRPMRAVQRRQLLPEPPGDGGGIGR